VETKIVCRCIVPSTVGPVFSISVVLCVKQLYSSAKLCLYWTAGNSWLGTGSRSGGARSQSTRSLRAGLTSDWILAQFNRCRTVLSSTSTQKLYRSYSRYAHLLTNPVAFGGVLSWNWGLLACILTPTKVRNFLRAENYTDLIVYIAWKRRILRLPKLSASSPVHSGHGP